MTADQLSEVHVRTLVDVAGRAHIVVTHLPTMTRVEVVGSTHPDAKREAYALLAAELTEKGL